MTIDKAIEILEDILTCVKLGDPPEEHESIRLGIEALKRIEAGRVAGHILWEDWLPGETLK